MGVVAVCWKPVPLGWRVDPLSGEVEADMASIGVSAADEAALEWGLRSAELLADSVRLLSAGPAASSHAVLAAGAAAGAHHLVHIEADPTLSSDSIARLLTPHLGDVDLVWCGDVSPDRGSGSVPAFIADGLGLPQALGLVEVDLSGLAAGAGIAGLRRLDGGRLERLRASGRCVFSCEGGTARLRRAPLPAVLGAAEVPLDCSFPAATDSSLAVASVGPFRPRTRLVPPPSSENPRERIAALTGAADRPRARERLVADPPAAAAAIAAALREWGELP